MHANFIVNDRGATSRDILDLIQLAKDTVREQHRIELETEVKIFGVEAMR
jgi:UDP-N-acetylmuramate dehydrogenase